MATWLFNFPSVDINISRRKTPIGIRSYSIQEIEEKLHKNSLVFCNKSEVHSTLPTVNQSFDHRFHIMKIKTIQPTVEMEWVQLENPQYLFPLEMFLFETYADNCVKADNIQEGIQTLQSLV